MTVTNQTLDPLIHPQVLLTCFVEILNHF